MGMRVRHASSFMDLSQGPAIPTAGHATVEKGSAVTLTWDSANATKMDLEPGVGVVQDRGSVVVRPGESTTCTLTATGAGGTKSSTTHVNRKDGP